MTFARVPVGVIQETIGYLRASSESECVVLWLGRRDATGVAIRTAVRPLQHAAADYFRIPPESMTSLMGQLRAERLMVAAQVHTHPGEAYHSAVDDEWALVRHEGALSLVVPRFCQRTTPETFVADAKVYRLQRGDLFVEVRAEDAYEVIP